MWRVRTIQYSKEREKKKKGNKFISLKQNKTKKITNLSDYREILCWTQSLVIHRIQHMWGALFGITLAENLTFLSPLLQGEELLPDNCTPKIRNPLRSLQAAEAQSSWCSHKTTAELQHLFCWWIPSAHPSAMVCSWQLEMSKKSPKAPGYPSSLA